MEQLRTWLDGQRGRCVLLADALGITSGAISQWTQVPPNRAIAVEHVTGISRHVLCPDVFGPAPKKEKVA
ncbi:MAG: Cro/CI family transcriptional regulator [Rhizobiaceae bacterium]